MEDPRWLRLITTGLILAALAVGYFLLSGRLGSNTVTRTKPQATQVPSISPSPFFSPNPLPSPSPSPVSSPGATPASGSAYNAIVDRSKGGVQSLPNTGFPVGLAVVFSISVIISGWGLRKFPK